MKSNYLRERTFGTSSHDALLNTVWFNKITEVCAGRDVKLRENANGEEYIENFERQTKTRAGENPRDLRKITPKMYPVPTNSPEKDPVFVYKFYAEKCPSKMNTDETPFYLTVNHCKKASSDKSWSGIGVNTR